MTESPRPWRSPPRPLRGAERGSWAHTSIVDRLPEIGRRTLLENDFSDEVHERIEALIDEIPDGPIRPIEDPAAPDEQDWRGYVEPHRGSDWLDPPWFFVETYFYRRIVAATGFFTTETARNADPFRAQKARGLARAEGIVAAALRRDELSDTLLAALWGNQADLSLWPEGEDGQRTEPDSPAADRILRDDRQQLLQHLQADSELNRIDIVLDNAGAELAADLCLADGLLRRYPEIDLHLHAKAHPTFVSDATVYDVEHTLHTLRRSAVRTVSALAARLQRALTAGSLRLRAPLFWTSPLPGWDLPQDLRAELSSSSALISKGDANYRRLLGDRRWEPTTPLRAILSYLPAPAAALRTLKSDVAAGLTSAAVQRAKDADPDWMIDGRWALIQFCDPRSGAGRSSSQ